MFGQIFLANQIEEEASHSGSYVSFLSHPI